MARRETAGATPFMGLSAFRMLRIVLQMFLACHAVLIFLLPELKVFPNPLDFNTPFWLDTLVTVAVIGLVWSVIADFASFGAAGCALYAVGLFYSGWTDERPLVFCLYTCFGILATAAASALIVVARDKDDGASS